jgi:hypothetical protein
MGTRRAAALYLLAWLMLGVLLAGLLAATTGARWAASVWFVVPLVLVFGYASGFSAYYLCRAYPLATKPLGTVITVFAFSAVSAAALWCAAALGWWQALAPWWEGTLFSGALMATMFGLGVLLYGMTAVASYLAFEFERARRAETRELETKVLAREAQLRMLRTQIDPHFLFNSLNSISALTAIDPAGARNMTLQLAEFFRHTLGLEAHRKVALEEELALVRRFLAIEQVRFGARLGFEQDVGPGAAACLLPPMILQPLVENAVKHGIGQMLEGGTVRVSAQRAGSMLRVRVENDAGESTGRTAGQGIGLINVRQRLAAAYGHQGSVHWGREDGQFRVDIALPAQTGEA